MRIERSLDTDGLLGQYPVPVAPLLRIRSGRAPGTARSVLVLGPRGLGSGQRGSSVRLAHSWPP